MGLHGDGITDDGEALQRALDQRPSLLEIPAGQYKIGRTLRISGGTRIKADERALFRLADGVARKTDDYLLTNANPELGDADIAIEGGIWDGNNQANARPTGLFDEGPSGAMIHFRNVINLRLEKMRLHNAEAYYLRATHLSHFHFEEIRFSSDCIRHNNDGIHLGGFCEDGVIRNIKGMQPGVTGDDMIALNADDALNRTEVRGMTCGPIRRLLVEDIEAEGCHSFIRMLSVWSPIEDVTIRRVRGTCEVAALNCDAARGCRVPLFDEAKPPFADGVGDLRNIKASDFIVAKSAENPIALLRLETRMSNFILTNFQRDMERDMSPALPTLKIQHVSARSVSLQPGNRTAHFKQDESFESHETRIERLAINAE
jgi:hypothetical protein